MEKMTIYVRHGKSYEQNHEITDKATVYERLTNDLIAKKINACTYIKSIKRINLYTGFQKIIVYYDNGVKTEYIVKN